MSPSKIANGLNAGHEGLDLLHRATQGDSESIKSLIGLLESTLELSQQNTLYRESLRPFQEVAPPSQTVSHTRRSADTSPQAEIPLTRPLKDRPLPLSEIRSGVRRVPKFFGQNGVPLLLYARPQPAIVGRIWRSKARLRDKRFYQQQKIKEQTVPLGQQEDAWDELVRTQMQDERKESGLTALDQDRLYGPSARLSWAAASAIACANIRYTMEAEDQKHAETARWMFGILQQERELAALEKDQKRQERARTRLARLSGKGSLSTE